MRINALYFFLVVFLIGEVTLADCSSWLEGIKFSDLKSCLENCSSAQTTLSTYMCPLQCESLCKGQPHQPVIDNVGLYGLTEDEIKFCSENKIACIQAYKLSWEADRLCLTVYPVSDVNDESDACRHYIWSILLSKNLGLKHAETILNAHENNSKEPKNQRAMDLANNRFGLLDYQLNKENLKNDDSMIQRFISELKKNKFIIIKENYSKNGGLP